MVCQIYSNDDLRLTFDLFTARSNVLLFYHLQRSYWGVSSNNSRIFLSYFSFLILPVTFLWRTREYYPRIIIKYCRPRWLSWMRRPAGDQEVAGSTPAEVGNIPSWRLIMKYFLRSFSPFRWLIMKYFLWSFSPFRWFKKGSCQFLAKECAQYWLTS